MAATSFHLFLTILCAVLTVSSPITNQAVKSTNYTATFDDVPSGPFYASPQLGSYVYEPYIPKFPPTVPTPYNGLAWKGFYVVNNSTKPRHPGGYTVHAGGLLSPTSGDNYAIGFRNATDPNPTPQTITTAYAGSTATAFTLHSCSYGCFLDDDGNYVYDGYYFPDEITAVDCVLRFTAYQGSAVAGSRQLDYVHGCQQKIGACTRAPHQMQRVVFGGVFANATSVSVAVESYIIRGQTSYSQLVTGQIEVVVGLDSCKYTVVEGG